MNVNLNLTHPLFPGKNDNRPLVIAGPCSAETEEQVLNTAHQLSDIGVKIFRAGIWKPRTRPNAFEGIGSEGLPWLKRVKEETGMLIATEVANAKHAYEALKFGVDVIWIGARTTADPFAVQEIADALKGLDIPVLVKNPVNPDVELWIGALERFNNVGIKRLAAIHRGFSSANKTIYRNPPCWQIPIELRRRIPDLPIIIDPSHMAGKRDLIMDLSQYAMNLAFDGMIIEVHCNPDEAWSDAAQQIVPEQLGYILSNLKLRDEDIHNRNAVTLEELRAEIDHIDSEIVDIMARRMKVSDQIGQFKKENNLTVLQSNRWNKLLNKMIDMGLDKGLSDEFVSKIYDAIHVESINHQQKVMKDNRTA